MGKLNNGADGEMTVLMHFSHDHALELTKLLKTNQAICSGCGFRVLPGEDYFDCATCDFSLHRDCSELPRKIHHPSDPNHELILMLSPSFHCRACGTPGSGFSYNCNICLGDIHSLCAKKPLSAIHEAHPHWLTLEFKTPYIGEEGFQCDICEQPGFDQWLYRCQQCDYDVHLRCCKSQAGPEVRHIIQERPAFEASSRALSLPNSTQKPVINVTSVAPSVQSCESFRVSKHANVSGTTQQALANHNMAITTAQGYLTNAASPPLPMVISQNRPNVGCVYRSSKSSIGFQANDQALDRTSGSRSGINQAIRVTPNRTITNTTRGPINNANPPMAATQHRPNITYAQRGANHPSGRQMYCSNGFVHLSRPQARDNLPIHLRPNGKAPMPIVLQRNQGSTHAAAATNEANQGGMVVGEVPSGVGQAFGEEMFQELTGGWDLGSKGLNLDGGSEIVIKALRKLILPW